MSAEPTTPSQYENLSIKMVLSDMDGTLLRSDGSLPDGMFDLLRRLNHSGITFVPASGRQYATLANLFDGSTAGMPIVAENGAYIVRDGMELASFTLSREFVVATVELLRRIASKGREIGVVLAGKNAAYVERDDEAFMEQVRTYYHANEVLSDQLAYNDEILKIAIFDFDDAESGTLPYLEHLRSDHTVVVSGTHWIDIMDPRVNKGLAVRTLQEKLSIPKEQTMAFGDYPNDIEMLEAVSYPFAMANGHEDVLSVSDFIAPSNEDGGVITVLSNILAQN